MQIKTALTFHFTPTRTAKMENSVAAHAGEAVEQEEPSPWLVEVQTRTDTLKINMAVSLKIGNP